MSTVVPLHFRPTIVVCVGTAGREIGEQLALLLPSLDPARRAGVAVLAVSEEDFAAQGQLIGRWFDPDLTAVMEHAGPAGPATSTGGLSAPPTPLPRLMVEALRGQDARAVPAGTTPRSGVLDDATISRIQDDSSAVSKMTAVVWIAAALESQVLVPIAEAVREAMESEHVEAQVLLALANIPPHEPEAHRKHDYLCGGQPWEQLLLDSNGDKALAAFAYLFEAQGEQRTYWAGRYDVPFAAAEAIFVMTATGLTITHEFEMSLRRSLPRMVKYPYERISGAGACRLTFPRAQAEQYCANRLGAELLRAWAPQETPDERAANFAEAEQRAAAFIADLNNDIRDSDAKLRGGRPSPRLSAQAFAHSGGLARQKPDGGLIFSQFNYSEFMRFINDYRDLPEVLAQQNEKANHGFAQWQDAVRARWEGYEHERERELGMQANDLMVRGVAGIAEARAYMSELHQLLAAEQDRLATKRENRELAFERFLSDMELRSLGPWTLEEQAKRQAKSVPGAQQTSYGLASTWQNSNTPNSALDDNEADAQATNTGRAWVEELVEQLTLRYRWQRSRRPSIAAIIGASIGVVPAGVLLGQILLPQQWFAQNRLALPILTAVLALIAGLCGWGLIAYQRWLERQAAEDLRTLYRRVQSYQCELYEDMRRAALLTGLHHRTRRLLDRLLEWSTFLASVAEVMERDAESVEQDLFDGATGRRDVMFANRHVLRRHDYNLRRFEQDVSVKRSNESIAGHTTHGVADWHRTPAAMLPYLRGQLQGINLLETTPEELKHPVRDFALSVVKPYLSGDMVSIGAALEAMPAAESAGIFDRLVRQAAILYKPATPSPRSTLFVAAREEFRRTIMKEDQAAGAVLLHIEDDEWLGLLRLQPGGAIPAFWPAGADAHTNIPAGPSWYQPAQGISQTGKAGA